MPGTQAGTVFGLRHRPDFTTRPAGSAFGPAAFLLVFLSPLLCGCLPILVGNARTLKPGQYSMALAGMGRTHSLPDSVVQAGRAIALMDFRGGLVSRLEAGMTLQIPTHALWDLKYQIRRESGLLLPSLALRAHLGTIQPSFGGALLASRTFGRLGLTALAGYSSTNERLWLEGSGAFSDDSENFTKQPLELGASLEYRLSGIHSFFLDVITWKSDPDFQEETPKSGEPFGIVEGRTWFFGAGLRIRWTRSPKPKPEAALTALRGRIVSPPAEGQFTVGEPGIYTATVFIDAYTSVLRDGRAASLEDLNEGVAVLIQGLPLPQQATFLARTIELK